MEAKRKTNHEIWKENCLCIICNPGGPMKVAQPTVGLDSVEGGELIKFDGKFYLTTDKPVDGKCQGVTVRTVVQTKSGQITELDYKTYVEHYSKAQMVPGPVRDPSS